MVRTLDRRGYSQVDFSQSEIARVRFVKPIFSKSCSNPILRMFSRSVFCVDFEFPKKNTTFFQI